ncbi:TetR/AcrR family transcriptional regulator [Pseudochelatococcus lubricantis]|uniref:TetR/AcrR family transcriptional regulator n=1 Tax=Pseudochelatococcus lubricantis TaxID=1538102 RepID=UPI0035E7DF59
MTDQQRPDAPETSAPAEPEAVKPASDRMRLKKQVKRAAILRAAVDEFTERGFANARLSSVAERAGVAKGTLYLYFRSKEDLFAGVVHETLLPPEGDRDGKSGTDASPVEAFRAFMLGAVADLQNSGRAGVALVALTEGHHFPQLVDIYIQAVLEPILQRISKLMEDGSTPRLDAIRRFPQLLVAPVVTGLLWNRFMTKHPPVDLVEIVDAQLSLVLGDAERREDEPDEATGTER